VRNRSRRPRSVARILAALMLSFVLGSNFLVVNAF